MGAALQVVNAQATNPGATVTSTTANAGDSLAVRNARAGTPVRLLNLWAFTTTNLLVRLRSPLLHDQAQNIRAQPPASIPRPLLDWQILQPLQAQDLLILELTGGAAEVDTAALLIYYQDLSGANARLHAPAEVLPLVQNITTVEVDLTSSGTAGNYSATVALNGTFDTLRANTDYAVLGYTCATVGSSLGITGPDTGNLRLGGPLYNQSEVTASWFVFISQMTGLPLIPVINSANRAGTNLDVTAQATATSFKVGVNLAQLSNPSGLS